MAGIEKICEYSGEYEGEVMYKDKHNHIQVLKKHRKHFKGKRAYLYFVETPDVHREFTHRWIYLKFSLGIRRIWLKIMPKFWSAAWWYPCLKEYTLFHYYVLYVPDCPGNVDGLYLNWTYSPAKVIRNLDRLVDLQWVDYVWGSTNKNLMELVKEDINTNASDF